MAEKMTFMKLKVDLECSKCSKKVKKVLSKYPQIRDQKFDEKANIVFITVVCCSPEKIRDKLCYKGGGSIKSIEIVEPSKPDKKEEAKPKPQPEKNKEADKPKADPPKKEANKPKAEPEKKKDADKPKAEPEKKKEADKPKAEAPKKEADKPAPPLVMQPQVPPPMAVPLGMCVPYYEGRPVGPFYEYGGPVLSYDGYYGRPVYDSYGGGRPYYVSRCDPYFNEENATGCTVM